MLPTTPTRRLLNANAPREKLGAGEVKGDSSCKSSLSLLARLGNLPKRLNPNGDANDVAGLDQVSARFLSVSVVSSVDRLPASRRERRDSSQPLGRQDTKQPDAALDQSEYWEDL